MPLAANIKSPSASKPAKAGHAYGWLIAAMLVLFVANIFVFASRPAEGSSYAVIVAPHVGEAGLMRTIAAADGLLVRESRYPWLAIVSPAQASSETDFAGALRSAGAVLLLHPAILAGCFTADPHVGRIASLQTTERFQRV